MISNPVCYGLDICIMVEVCDFDRLALLMTRHDLTALMLLLWRLAREGCELAWLAEQLVAGRVGSK